MFGFWNTTQKRRGQFFRHQKEKSNYNAPPRWGLIEPLSIERQHCSGNQVTALWQVSSVTKESSFTNQNVSKVKPSIRDFQWERPIRSLMIQTAWVKNVHMSLFRKMVASRTCFWIGFEINGSNVDKSGATIGGRFMISSFLRMEKRCLPCEPPW